MSKKLKLIWDFRGPDAEKIAQHHVIHLNEYIEIEKYILKITGSEKINDVHCIAYMVVTQETMIGIRDVLKPHRGEWYDN